MLYSIGKDSSVMVRLAQKAFHPGPHSVSTAAHRHHLQVPEMIEFRDRFCAEIGAKLIVHTNQQGDRRRRQSVPPGHAEMLRPAEDARPARRPDRGRLRRGFGGARRDEEKSRAKERIYSFRDSLRPVGPQESASRAVESLQQPHRQRREHPRLPAFQLDRAGRLALHPPGEHSDRAAVLRQRRGRWWCAATR